MFFQLKDWRVAPGPVFIELFLDVMQLDKRNVVIDQNKCETQSIKKRKEKDVFI